jgi:hypothetical protein
LIASEARGLKARSIGSLEQAPRSRTPKDLPWEVITINRIVALGASNLTRGFHTIVSAARSAWGPEVQIFAALGHGRSYGAPSRVLVRTLPGILESGLWHALASQPSSPGKALITDVGNDILYGCSVEQILTWVDKAAQRLLPITPDIVLTDLPLASIRQLSAARFLFFRSMLFPACKLSLAEVVEKIEHLNEGLAALAIARNLRFFRLNPSWYGLDPVHIRPVFWRTAWMEILDAPAAKNAPGSSLGEGLKLYFMAPERRHLFGIEQVTPQAGVSLPRGARVWLY